jgi:HTH-type transcriptional regulator / antitoxin HipB
MRTITTLNQIGAILASRRKHLKLSQSEIAARIGISQNRLSVLESNPATLSAKQLLALLNALDLEMTILDRAPQAKATP